VRRPLRRAPLFPAHDLRDGYLRADPADPAAVLTAVLKARDLVGGFDKPRYIAFTEDLCAHFALEIVGCRRCLDLCPTGAIAPAGNHVAIDPNICAGCGQCAAVCPTGAAPTRCPPADTLLRKLRAMLTPTRRPAAARDRPAARRAARRALIDALARHGDGLPAHVLPLSVNEVTQVGLEAVRAAFAYGAIGCAISHRAKPRHDIAGLHKTIALAEPILAGLGFGAGRVATIETDDPFGLGKGCARSRQRRHAAAGRVHGGRRQARRAALALRELHHAAPAPVDIVALPAGAPFGTVEINVEGCTLCLSCVSACPTVRAVRRSGAPAAALCRGCLRAMRAVQGRPAPRRSSRSSRSSISRRDRARARAKEEEPFCCIRCSKPFGVKSSVERVAAKLEGKHWMFQNSASAST
jgi:ferredoxin